MKSKSELAANRRGGLARTPAKRVAARRRPAVREFARLVERLEADPSMLLEPMFRPALSRLHALVGSVLGAVQPRTDEQRARMSEARRGKPLSDEHRRAIAAGVRAHHEERT